MIAELDSKKVYDEPRHIYHESVHSPRKYILSGGNDGSYISPGQNDLKADIILGAKRKSSK